MNVDKNDFGFWFQVWAPLIFLLGAAIIINDGEVSVIFGGLGMLYAFIAGIMSMIYVLGNNEGEESFDWTKYEEED